MSGASNGSVEFKVMFPPKREVVSEACLEQELMVRTGCGRYNADADGKEVAFGWKCFGGGDKTVLFYISFVINGYLR